MGKVDSRELYTFDIVKEQPYFYAKMFSEGNKRLEKLLIRLFEHNVSTRSCCIGHNKKPYICFDNIDSNIEEICSMINQIYKYEGVVIETGAVTSRQISSKTGLKSIVFRLNKSNSNEMYDIMSEALDTIDSNAYQSLPIDIKKAMDICFDNSSYIIPHGGIACNPSGFYFYHPFTFLAKEFTNEHVAEYNERLNFHSMLSNIGFKEEDYRWFYKSDNHLEIIDKLDMITLGQAKIKSR
ncbi:MAG: hypothetical protein PHI22_00765 [Bacilli bacterium]|nr:hypothetical protein [Bacilli bacterium]